MSPASVTPGDSSRHASPLPSINVSDGIVTQPTKEESPVAPETEVVTTPPESAAPQVVVSPVAVLKSTARQPEADLAETVAQAHRKQAAAPASNDQASTPSTPASSTLTPKKRRSLFARIKHVFGKDKDKQESKEKNQR